MNESAEFLRKHQRGSALPDANMLLVYVIGKTTPRMLTSLQHTKQYADAFPLIERIVEMFPKLYTTPNVLTEVSNLGRKVGPQFFDTFGKVLTALDEQYCMSRDCVADSHFTKLGLTDAGLMRLSGKTLILTFDFPLYQTLRSRGVDAVNMFHLLPYKWTELIRR